MELYCSTIVLHTWRTYSTFLQYDDLKNQILLVDKCTTLKIK